MTSRQSDSSDAGDQEDQEENDTSLKLCPALTKQGRNVGEKPHGGEQDENYGRCVSVHKSIFYQRPQSYEPVAPRNLLPLGIFTPII